MQGWSVNADLGAGSVVSTRSFNGSYALAFSGITSSDAAYLDFFSPLANSAVEAGDWINFRVYIPASDIGSISDIGVCHRHGPDWEACRSRVGGVDLHP